MLDKVKAFFEKKKLAHKFANAPPGHKLGSASTSASSSSASPSSSKLDARPSSSSSSLPKSSFSLSGSSSASSTVKTIPAKMAAAEAAERRMAQQLEKNRVIKIPKSYLPPMEKEQNSNDEQKPETSEEKVNEDDLRRFNCPGLEINDYYPLAELKNQIVDKIMSNFGEDPVICGSLLIRNCNARDKADVCISTLEAILNNLQTSDEDKLAKFTRLRKIKIENKILNVKGGIEFLNGIGFTLSEDGEWFTLGDPVEGLSEKAQYYLDVLTSSEIFPIKLDREARFYDLNDLNTPNVDFDDRVFEYSKDELAREQQMRKEIADRESTLMTKAMRDRYITKKPKTRYTRLRYKRLDLKMIEATFRTNETIIDLINWLRVNYSMEDIDNYDIACGTKIIPSIDWSKTLFQLDFYPKVTFYQRCRSNDQPME